jgi:hypothetical protein
VKAVSGARDPATVVDESVLRDLVLQLPEDAGVESLADLEELGEDPDGED